MMIFHYMINVNVSLSKKDLPGGRSEEHVLFPPNSATMDKDDNGKCPVKHRIQK